MRNEGWWNTGQKIDRIVAQHRGIRADLFVDRSLARKIALDDQNASAVSVWIGLEVPILKAERACKVGDEKRKISFHAQAARKAPGSNLIASNPHRPIGNGTPNELINAVGND